MPRVNKPDTRDSLSYNSFSWSYSYLSALLYADLGYISVLRATIYTFSIRAKNKIIELPDSTCFGNNFFHRLCFHIYSIESYII